MKKKMNLAKAPVQIELEKDEKLDKINIQSLSTTKTFFTIFFTITSIIYIILGVAIIVNAGEHGPNANPLQIAYGIVLMAVGPFSQIFLAFFVNLFVSMAYDTKIIKYTMLYAKENISDKNLKIPEEYEPVPQLEQQPSQASPFTSFWDM